MEKEVREVEGKLNLGKKIWWKIWGIIEYCKNVVIVVMIIRMYEYGFVVVVKLGVYVFVIKICW